MIKRERKGVAQGGTEQGSYLVGVPLEDIDDLPSGFMAYTFS